MSQALKIGYAGSLRYYKPGAENIFFRWFRHWFWHYKADRLDFSTRSGYYLFQGLKKLKKRYGITGGDLQVRLWGIIRDGNQRQVHEFGISDMVHIEGYYPMQESKKKLRECDVVLLPLESEKNSTKPLFIPGKLYEYLKLEKPILALAGDSDCTDILNKSGLGIVVNPYVANDVAKKIKELIDRKEELPKLYQPDKNYISNFSFKNITNQLAAVFDELSRE